VHPEDAERPELPGQVTGRDPPLVEPLGDVRAELARAEPSDGVPDRPLLVGEEAVDRI